MSEQPQDPQADEYVGQTIGGYRVESLLGVGGMGRVYKAVAPDGSAGALELIKSALARDEIFRRRFLREARIAQQVKHPHLVPVLSTGEYEGVPYLAQRFVEGGSLERRLQERGRLAVDTAVRLCVEVARGLDALWAAGLVHRDVKPANILLDEHDTAHLTDFGLAKDRGGSV